MDKCEPVINESLNKISPKSELVNIFDNMHEVTGEKSSASSKYEIKPNNSSCRVCQDQSTGKHYGQITCEGCKSFFKRSIRRKIDYVCRNNGTCTIYMEMRNQCQACRFAKCQQVGMKNDAVQRMRIISSYSLSNRNSTNTKSEKTTDEEGSNEDWDNYSHTAENTSTKIIVNSILQAEKCSPILRVENSIDQSMRIIYAIGEWTKKIIFSDQILAADQLLLLQNSWSQLFLLNYYLCGLTNKLLYRGNASNNSFYTIQSQLLALSRMPIDLVEIGCLKAIIFFNPDTHLLFNCSLVDKAQESFQEALEQHIKHNYPSNNRFGRLLLRIPYLKEVTSKQIMEVFFNNPNDENGNYIYEFFQRSLITSAKRHCESKSLNND